MENKTQMGLLLLIIGMIIGIFSTLGSLAASGGDGTTLSATSLMVSLISFLSFILLLVGWILLIVGRKEFGEKHDKFVIYSVVILIVGIVIVIIGTVITTFAGIAGSMEASNGEVSMDYVEMARGMKSAVAFSQLGGIVVTIAAILLVYNLENDIGKKVLFLALIASIAVAIISMIFLPSVLDDLADDLEEMPEEDREDEFYKGLNKLGMYSGLGIISSILLIIGYYIPYDRIKKGELKPVTFPTGPYGQPPYPPPYPGTYPPQYPYQPYPPYQQPPYPPTGPPPGEGGPPPEGVTPPGPSAEGAVRPTAVPSEQGIITCPYCGTQIPAGSTVCPICKKNL
jgi:MFS family permease